MTSNKRTPLTDEQKRQRREREQATIQQAREALLSNQHLRGYLSSLAHPFDSFYRSVPRETLERRSLLTYYEWGIKKARHFKKLEIARAILKLPVTHINKPEDK